MADNVDNAIINANDANADEQQGQDAAVPMPDQQQLGDDNGTTNNANGGVKQPDEQAQQDGGVPAMEFTEEQMKRMVNCLPHECDHVVEVPWHLMMQSGTFREMWLSLFTEDSDFLNSRQKSGGGSDSSFVFPLNDINAECFERIIDWMREHHGQPNPVVREDPITGERIWFDFTDWEREFFNVDFEVVKEYYLAANFLDLRSLYLYCAQECARCIMDKSPEEIREMLALPDDMTEEEKDQLRAEFEIHDPAAAGAAPPGAGAAPEPAALVADQNGAVPADPAVVVADERVDPASAAPANPALASSTAPVPVDVEMNHSADVKMQEEAEEEEENGTGTLDGNDVPTSSSNDGGSIARRKRGRKTTE